MALPLLLLLAASTAVTVSQQRAQAGIQSAELERQADQEKISAEGLELQRRQRLNKILAANVVSQAVSGTTGEGTPAAISLSSAKQASISEGIESLSDRLRRSQLTRQASNIRGAGKIQAVSTLLKGGFQAARLS